MLTSIFPEEAYIYEMVVRKEEVVQGNVVELMCNDSTNQAEPETTTEDTGSERASFDYQQASDAT